MPRAATTSDVFNAIAEPRRRDILMLLTDSEHQVNDIAKALEMGQPAASKHLKVLREVGLVRMRRSGQRRLYISNGQALKPVHQWVSTFEKFWDTQLSSIKAIAEANAGNTEKDKRDIK